jgi:hypothetical protein
MESAAIVSRIAFRCQLFLQWLNILDYLLFSAILFNKLLLSVAEVFPMFEMLHLSTTNAKSSLLE